MGLSLAQVGKAATLERTAVALRRLLQGQTARFETGIEGRLAWLDAPRAIPIYLAGSGPRMLETAGRLGDGAIVYATVSPDVLKVALERVVAGARAAGRAPGDLDVALWAPMSIGRDRERARDHARGRVASACRHPLPVRLSDEDEAAMRRVRESYDAYQHATAAARHRTLVTDRLVDLMALVGTPDDVAAQVGRLRGVAGLARVIAFPQAPGDGFAAREQILTMFVEAVRLRGGCASYAWVKPNVTAEVKAHDEATCRAEARNLTSQYAYGGFGAPFGYSTWRQPWTGPYSDLSWQVAAEEREYERCMRGRGYDLVRGDKKS